MGRCFSQDVTLVSHPLKFAFQVTNLSAVLHSWGTGCFLGCEAHPVSQRRVIGPQLAGYLRYLERAPFVWSSWRGPLIVVPVYES